MILVRCCAYNFAVLDRLGRDLFNVRDDGEQIFERLKLKYTRG